MGSGDPFPCRRPLVVMGVSGAGKTTVGMAIARNLRVPYADADDFHSEAAVSKMSTLGWLGVPQTVPLDR
jgi:gluconokinase